MTDTAAPRLVTEADFQRLAERLLREHEASGMSAMMGDIPLVPNMPAEQQRGLHRIADLIGQFGRTFDMSEEQSLSTLAVFTLYLCQTRLPLPMWNAPMLAALMAIRDHFRMVAEPRVRIQ